ncbi:ABC transporter substrate-binding protein [Lacticaseibacillus pabuli]|uniref:ABC transporter substrate-binding protein n=1 Tax=Lacticaseibacillus pabuli TaxID=3025672 RepID=A0ABY7WRM1_9LACO|nr:ABC transporter substrate-binding protein [Lacticaseibacillus sp. KACC 23028]WDF82832.1 ABC transporter substrate-binding protein [Lacticaseibacillus sp. KACC 23028]
MKKTTMKKMAGAAATLAAMVMMAGCSTAAGNAKKGNTASGSTMKVGVNMELSGAAAGYGEQMKQGIELAISEINKDGGVKVGGKKYKMQAVYRDNKTTTSGSASVAAQLVNNDKVSAIVGPATTNDATASIPNITKAAVAQVSPSATDPDYTLDKNGKVQPYVFRSCFENNFQGGTAARFANDTLKSKKVAVIADNSTDYGTGLAKAFKKEYNGKVVSTQYFQEGDKDFNAILTSIKNKGFDAIYAPGYYSEIGLIVKQARQMGIKTPIIGSDGMADPKLAKIAGDSNATKVYYTTPFSTMTAATDKTVKNFMDNFKSKFHQDAPTFSALAYDSVYMVKTAAQQEKSTNSADIAKGLAKIKGMKGATGTMTVDKQHNPKKPIAIEQMTNGKVVKAYTVK